MNETIIEKIVKELSDYISPLWNSVTFWRIFTLVLLLVISVAISFRNKILLLIHYQTKNDFDKKIFIESDNIASEIFLIDFLNDLDMILRYNSSSRKIIDEYVKYFSQTGNNFINKEIRIKLSWLLNDINILRDLVGQHFFSLINSDVKDEIFELYPDRSKYPEAFEKYLRYGEIVRNKIMSIEQKYKAYRRTIVRQLKV